MLKSYFGAAFPAVAVSTCEEVRFVQSLLAEFPEKTVLAISAVGGLRDLRTHAVLDETATFGKAFAAATHRPETLLVVFDWQGVARNAAAYRALKDQFVELKARGCCIVLIAPSWNLPHELQHDLPILEWSLPSRDQLREALTLVADSAGETVDATTEAACLDAAAGLTLQEAENSFALALVECNALDANRIAEEKMRLVKNSGFLEVWPAVAPESVGGLDALKDYFVREVLPSRDDADLRVRGVMLVGIPGTGKSLAAKAAGALLGWPVLRLDIGALKGSLVGQSESNMRAALKLAEAVAPCVLWLDELEKGVGGYQSSAQTDSGVTLGMVGSLLTWQQEHKAPVLTIATVNDHSKLPAELTRAGRFDESFFVDIPNPTEREHIAGIHLARFGCEPGIESATNGGDTRSDGSGAKPLASHIAELSHGWTGAEIEQLVKSAARRANRRPTPELLTSCAAEVKPLMRTRATEFNAMRVWARNALRFANTPDETDAAPARGRKLSRGKANDAMPFGPAESGGISLN